MVFVSREQYKLYNRKGDLVKESAKTKEGGISLGGGGEITTAHVTNFFEAIRGKEQLNAPIDDASKSNHMALLANISYRTGKSFDVDTSNGRPFDKDAMKLWSREYEPGWEIE